MSNVYGLNRRSFLKNAGMTALAGAVGTGSAAAVAAESSSGSMGGKFDFDTPYDRIGSDCYKWDHQIDVFGAEKFKTGMGVATMDFRAAPCITEALAERCKHENWGYLNNPYDSYIESVVNWNGERYDLDIDPDSVVVSSGVYAGLIAAIRTFSAPASKVLLLAPSYSGFYWMTTHTRTIPSDSLLKYRDGQYEIDWDDLESRMTPDTHAMMLCNPQNPTGNVWSKEDLLRLGRMCLENRVVVLADEIHCDLVRPGQKYTPFASLPDKAVVDNSVTFKAISKTFNLAGMKNAYFHSTNPIYLERVKANHRQDINVLGLVANEAAYRHGGEWIDQLLPYLDENHNYAEQYIKQNMPLVGYHKAQGTYLNWLDMSKVIDAIGAEEMAAASNMTDSPITTEQYVEIWFVENAGVQLNPGSMYGTGGPGHMRINLGTSRQTIKVGLDSIATALRSV